MAHHWMTDVTDETHEVMQGRSNKGSLSYAGPYSDKYNKKINAEADEGLRRYNAAMAYDIHAERRKRTEAEEWAKKVLAVLENKKFRSMTAVNPRNTPLVQEIAKEILNQE